MLDVFALEINAVTQCNLACVGCSHSSPISPTSNADPEEVYSDLSRLAAVVTLGELRILGGEPLLHPDLTGLMRAARRSQIGGVTRLYTNGVRLHRGSWAWLEFADEVQLSIYPGAKLDTQVLTRFSEACASADVKLIPKQFHSFRLSRPSSPLSDDEISIVYDTCQMAHSRSCHTVQAGRVYICPPSAPARIGNHGAESCAIEPVDDLATRLESFLSERSPLRACAGCLGTVGMRINHRQGNAKTWLELTARGSIDWEQVQVLRRDPMADNGCCETISLGRLDRDR